MFYVRYVTGSASPAPLPLAQLISCLFLSLPLWQCYEGFVIWSFFSFLLEFMGGEAAVVSLLSNKQAEAHHMAPFKWCLKPWSVSDSTFVRRTKFGVLQYVPLRLACALLSLIAQQFGFYGSGEFEPQYAYPWLTLITNCSQIWAMYCLVLLYHASIDYIAPIKPFVKFLCVKMVVFFTFWQSVIIALAVYAGKITDTETYDTEQISAALQDFLICIEMFIAAIAHGYAFPSHEFHDETQTGPALGRISSVFVPTDIAQSVAEMGTHAAREVHAAAKRALPTLPPMSGWGVNQNQKLLAEVRERERQLGVAGHGPGPVTPGSGRGKAGMSLGSERSAAPSPLPPPPLIASGSNAGGGSSAGSSVNGLEALAIADDRPSAGHGFDSLPASPANRDLHPSNAANPFAHANGNSAAGPAVGEWRAL